MRLFQVSEEFLVEHHMNYGLESTSGIRYDLQHQSYVQERQGMSYKLEADTQQWIPLDSYTDEINQIKYNFSKKHHTWIPEQSTYSSKATDAGQPAQTYVWLKEQLQWALMSSVDAYTDHLTGRKYKWNNDSQAWDDEGVEPIEKEEVTRKVLAPPPPEPSQTKKKGSEGWFDLPEEKNCNVYVTGLPLDMSDAEFEGLMSKYGIISPDPSDPRQKKIRLYRDEHNQPKGDGRCRFVRVRELLCRERKDTRLSFSSAA